jgi:hypothetical protein
MLDLVPRIVWQRTPTSRIVPNMHVSYRVVWYGSVTYGHSGWYSYCYVYTRVGRSEFGHIIPTEDTPPCPNGHLGCKAKAVGKAATYTGCSRKRTQG